MIYINENLQYTFCDLNFQSASLARDFLHVLVIPNAQFTTEKKNEEPPRGRADGAHDYEGVNPLGDAILTGPTCTCGGGGTLRVQQSV